MAFSARACCLSLLFLSVAGDAQEIQVDRDDDGLVVRSAISQGNFLFRAGSRFEEAEAEEPFLVDLEAGQAARIRLRIRPITGDELRGGLQKAVAAREADYRAGIEGEAAVEGEGARCRIRITAGDRARTVLVVADGKSLYELYLDQTGGDKALADELAKVAAGFTILDPKGAPLPKVISAEDLKAEKIEHDYYRIKMLKPAGFTREEVDPDSDPGIFLHLRKEDADKNLCAVKIRVFLAKAVKKSLEEMAQARIDRFRQQYTDVKGPTKPKRGRWSGAKNAYAFKLVGKGRHGIVVEEEWRVFEHKNGRLYQIQMTLYGGAAREFRADIKSFWRNLRIRSS